MKKTVTIGIAAHNEEKNIASLLESLVKQIGSNFVIKKIVVACDGCTDRTEQEITRVGKEYPIVSCINDHKRLGKAARINSFYKNLQTDIFICFDADVTVKQNVVEKIVNAFTDPRIGLVGGRVSILPQKTFVGKALVAQEYFWSQVIKAFTKGNNVQSHTGPVSAGSREFLQNVKRPKEIVADDHFLYFAAMQNKFLYKPVANLGVFITVPQTFRDYMKQSHRFLQSAKQLQDYFGNWIKPYYTIPYQLKIRAYAQALRRYPFDMTAAIVLTILQRLLNSFYQENYTDGIWTTVKSTK